MTTRRWASAADIPAGPTVTAPVCTSDTRMRWTRRGPDAFVRTYPGSHPVTVTAVEMDKHAGDAGWVEVQR